MLFYSGDDTDTKPEVADLIGKLGFVGIDFGDTGHGQLLQFPGRGPAGPHLVKFA